VRVLTHQEKVDQATIRVFQALVDLKYVGPTEFGRLTGGQRPRRGQPPARGGRGRARTARKAPRKAAARSARASRKSRR
jgi:hypothetical protein